MVSPKKHIENIVPYPVEPEIDWDLKLDFNENLIGPSPKVLKAIKNIDVKKIKFYPTYDALLNAIASYNKVAPESILAVNGTDEGYRYIFDAYCSYGDNILTVTPAFSMPKIYAEIAHCNYKEVPYTEKWKFPIDAFLEEISADTKMLIVTSPNSPTGDLISDEHLKLIIEKASDSLVVIDETYATYANKTYVHYPEQYKNVLVLKSMSKDFATAGLRLGYMVGRKEVIANVKRIASPYSVNSIAAVAGVAALDDVKHVETVKKEVAKSKKYLEKELVPYAQQVFPSETNFLCVDFGKRAKYYYKKLLRNNIKVKLLSGIVENCFRITVPKLSDAKKIVKVISSKKDLIIFDMDGVLVDASKSYRIAIQKTFAFFAKQEVSLDEIQALKNQGGYNNDWILTHKLLLDQKVNVKYETVVEKFNEFYFGDNGNGLISNEEWLISPAELKKLSDKYNLAIFTGRQSEEALFALRKAGVEDLFEPIITMDDLEQNEQKPSPKGIEIIKEILKPKKCWYLGDTIDDMKAGVSASVNAIGILPPQDKSNELETILKNQGAVVVLNSAKELFNYLEKCR